MATNYPGGLDSLSNPSAGSAQTSPSHAGQHANANDAIEAIQGELGTDPSGSAATVKARIAAIEADSRWTDQRTPVDGSVTPAKLSRPIGNLLTDNQSNGGSSLGSTEGFASFGASPDELVWDAARLGVVGTKSAAGAGVISTWNARADISYPWETHTVLVDLDKMTCASVAVFVRFANGAGEPIGNVQLGAEVTATGRVRVQGTVQPPAGTSEIGVDVSGYGPAGAKWAVYALGVWRGAGGQWTMPGEPVPYLGIRPNPDNTAQVQVWNTATSTWITV